ncbi:hypothetical protein [Saccharopolyspora sp. NPDC002376]
MLALYVCWDSAIPAMKLMVDTVPPLGGAAAIFLLAGVVLAGVARGVHGPLACSCDAWRLSVL